MTISGDPIGVLSDSQLRALELLGPGGMLTAPQLSAELELPAWRIRQVIRKLEDHGLVALGYGDGRRITRQGRLPLTVRGRCFL